MAIMVELDGKKVRVGRSENGQGNGGNRSNGLNHGDDGHENGVELLFNPDNFYVPRGYFRDGEIISRPDQVRKVNANGNHGKGNPSVNGEYAAVPGSAREGGVPVMMPVESVQKEKTPVTHVQVIDWRKDPTKRISVSIKDPDFGPKTYHTITVVNERGCVDPCAEVLARSAHEALKVMKIMDLLPGDMPLIERNGVVVEKKIIGRGEGRTCTASVDADLWEQPEEGGEPVKVRGRKKIMRVGTNDPDGAYFIRPEDRVDGDEHGSGQLASNLTKLTRIETGKLDNRSRPKFQPWIVDESVASEYSNQGRDVELRRAEVLVAAMNKSLELREYYNIQDPNEITPWRIAQHVHYEFDKTGYEKDAQIYLAGTPEDPRVVANFIQVGDFNEGTPGDELRESRDYVLIVYQVVFDADMNPLDGGYYEVLGSNVIYSEPVSEKDQKMAQALISLTDENGEIPGQLWYQEAKKVEEELNAMEVQAENERLKQIEAAREEAEAEDEQRRTLEIKALEDKKEQNKLAMATKMGEMMHAKAVEKGVAVETIPDGMVDNLVNILSIEEYDGDDWEQDIDRISVSISGEKSLLKDQGSKWFGDEGVVNTLLLRKNEEGEWEIVLLKGEEEVKLSRVQELNLWMAVMGVRELDEENPITGNVVEIVDEESGRKTWRATLESAGNDMEIVRTEVDGAESYKVVLNGVETDIEKSDWYYSVLEKIHGLMTGKYWFEKDGNINGVGSKIKVSDGRRKTLTWEDKFVNIGSEKWIDKEFADKMFFGSLAEVLDNSSDPESASRAIPINELAGTFAARSKGFIEQMEIVDGLIRDLRSAALGGRNSGYFYFDRVEVGNLKEFDFIRMPIHYGEKGEKQFLLEIGGDTGLSIYTNREEISYETVEGRKYHAVWKALNWLVGNAVEDEPDTLERIKEFKRVAIHPVLERVFLDHIKSALAEDENEFNAKQIGVIREFYRTNTPGIYPRIVTVNFSPVNSKSSNLQTYSDNQISNFGDYQPEDLALAKQRLVYVTGDNQKYYLRRVSNLSDTQKSKLFPEYYYGFGVKRSENVPSEVWVVETLGTESRTVQHPRISGWTDTGNVKVILGKPIGIDNKVLDHVMSGNIPVLADFAGAGFGEELEELELNVRSAVSGTVFLSKRESILLWEAEFKGNFGSYGNNYSSSRFGTGSYWGSGNQSGARVTQTTNKAGTGTAPGLGAGVSKTEKKVGGWEDGVREVLDGLRFGSGSYGDNKAGRTALFDIAENWSGMGEIRAREVMELSLRTTYARQAETLRPIFEQMMSRIYPEKKKTATARTAANIKKSANKTQTIPAAKGKTAPKPQEKAPVEDTLESRVREFAAEDGLSGETAQFLVNAAHEMSGLTDKEQADYIESMVDSLSKKDKSKKTKHRKMMEARTTLRKVQDVIFGMEMEETASMVEAKNGVGNEGIAWNSNDVYNAVMRLAAEQGVDSRIQGRFGEILKSWEEGNSINDLVQANMNDNDYLTAMMYLKDWRDKGIIGGAGKKTEAATGNDLNTPDVGGIDFNDIKKRAETEGYKQANIVYLMMAHGMLTQGSKSYEELLRDSESRDPGLNKALKDLAVWFPAK